MTSETCVYAVQFRTDTKDWTTIADFDEKTTTFRTALRALALQVKADRDTNTKRELRLIQIRTVTTSTVLA